MVALAVTGVRADQVVITTPLVLQLIINVIIGIVLPILLFAARPRRRVPGLVYAVFCLSALAALIFFHVDVLALTGGLWPPQSVIVVALGFFAVLLLWSPFFSFLLGLSAVSLLASALGVGAAMGYFGFEQGLPISFIAEATTLALTAAAMIGSGAGFDFAEFFATGITKQKAAASAGHSAIAPFVFAVLVACGYFGVASQYDNFGQVVWSQVGTSAVVMILLMSIVLCAAIGVLARARFGEQVAVDENYQRRWFVENWKPIRTVLPPSTSLAVTAIFGVAAVICAFEVGVMAPLSVLVLFSFVCVAALVAFVSARTTLLILLILLLSSLFARYFYSLLGTDVPGVHEQLFVYALHAFALSQLTVSWRDANENWRKGAEVAQAAMAVGARRFLITLTCSIASILVVAMTFSWPVGAMIAPFFAVTGLISLVVAPIVMIALSTQSRR